MKCLLDTHTYLWALNGSPLLSRPVLDAIEDGENELILSVASLWEIAIKVSIGKLELEMPFLDVAVKLPETHSITLVPVEPSHLDVILRLPYHHRDPFDRLLIAQCQVESAVLISRDDAFDRYGIDRLW